MQRHLGIDLAKILATLMVVFYHVAYYKLDYGYTVGSTEYIPNINRCLMNLCSISIPLFFMCSGYCSLSSASRTWKKTLKKVVTITLLTVFWNYITPFPYWFFITLSILYLATPVMQFLQHKYPVVYWGGILIIGFLTFGRNELVVFARAFEKAPVNEWWISGMFTSYAFVYYAIGDLFHRKKLSTGISITLIISGIAGSIWDSIILTETSGNLFDGVNASFCMASTFLMATGVFSLFEKIVQSPVRTAGFIESIASCCLPIYIFHSSLVRILDTHINTEYLPNTSLFILFTFTFLICLICWILGKAIIHTPYIRLLLKL